MGEEQARMHGDEMTIRFAEPGEVDVAVTLWRDSNEARTGGSPTPPETEAMVRGWMAEPEAILLVAEHDGRIVGMTLAVAAREVDDAGRATSHSPLVPGLCHVSLVYVAPGFWGRGIGARLLDRLLDEIIRRGYDRVQLWTHETNARARRLYVSRGFMLTDDRQVNPAGETIMRFERPLEADLLTDRNDRSL